MIWEPLKAWAVISRGGISRPAAQSAELLWLDLRTGKLSLTTRSPTMPSSPFHSASFSKCKHQAGMTERLHSWRIFCLNSNKIAWLLFVTPTEILRKVLSGLLCGLLLVIIHFQSVMFMLCGSALCRWGAARERCVSESFLLHSNAISLHARTECNVVLH